MAHSIQVNIVDDRETEITAGVFGKIVSATRADSVRETRVSLYPSDERGNESVGIYVLHTEGETAAEFSTTMTAEHLDDLIDMLVAVRAQARAEGLVRA